MAILDHVDATPDERNAYIKQSLAARRTADVGDDSEGLAATDVPHDDAEEGTEGELTLSAERFAEMQGKEQFVLTVSEKGFGKRSSSYAFRTSGRGGKGIAAMVVNERNGRLVASFPVSENDQIMLVTDGGQLIRWPVHDIRIAGRNVQGVRIFKTDGAEKVVSVERITEDETDGEDAGGAA